MAFYHWLGPAMKSYGTAKKEAEKENLITALEKIKMQQLVDQAAMEKLKFGEWQKDIPLNELERNFKSEQYGPEGFLRKKQASELNRMQAEDALIPEKTADQRVQFGLNKTKATEAEKNLELLNAFGSKTEQAKLDEVYSKIAENKAQAARAMRPDQGPYRSEEQRAKDAVMQQFIAESKGDVGQALLKYEQMYGNLRNAKPDDSGQKEAQKILDRDFNENKYLIESQYNTQISLLKSDYTSEKDEVKKQDIKNEINRLNREKNSLIKALPRTLDQAAKSAPGNKKGQVPRFPPNNAAPAVKPSQLDPKMQEILNVFSGAGSYAYDKIKKATGADFL